MPRARVFVVCALVGILLLLPGAGAVSSQSPPGTPGSSASDPRKPGGDHLAEEAYLASLRRAPTGVSAAQARAEAARQAGTLPKLTTLPASLDGQRSSERGASLQAPNNRWRSLGPATENSENTNPNADFH